MAVTSLCESQQSTRVSLPSAVWSTSPAPGEMLQARYMPITSINKITLKVLGYINWLLCVRLDVRELQQTD